MKRYFAAALVLAVGFLFTAGSSYSAEKSYDISQSANTQPQLVLQSVVTTDDATILNMEWRATENQEIAVFPPNHEMAFYITDSKRSKKYELIEVEGIAVKPLIDIVEAGDVVKFTLTFENIPASMKSFDLIEGRDDMEDTVQWHIKGVNLK